MHFFRFFYKKPILTKPTNNKSRLNLLETADNTNVGDEGKYISTETISDIKVVKENLKNSLKDETGTLAKRSKEVREKNESVALLETYIRDLWIGVKRRVYRKNEPAEVLTYYKLPLDGTVPRSIKETEIIALSNRLVEGDAKAVAAGYDPAINPSAAELEEVLKATDKEIKDVAAADRQMDEISKSLRLVRENCDLVIDEIIAELEFSLRKLDPPGRRRIMRSYGIKFDYIQGEPEEEAA